MYKLEFTESTALDARGQPTGTTETVTVFPKALVINTALKEGQESNTATPVLDVLVSNADVVPKHGSLTIYNGRQYRVIGEDAWYDHRGRRHVSIKCRLHGTS